MRRDLLRGGGSLVLSTIMPAVARPMVVAGFGGESFGQSIRDAEMLGRGRLGVAVLDTETGGRFGWRGEERFPVTSTFKFILAAAILFAVDRGCERLDRRVAIEPSDLVEYAPITGKQVGSAGLTVEALCEAVIVWSDNPAANLLLPIVGGPPGLTCFARDLGDDRFRLDRVETALNQAAPGDPRDTTTPQAMLSCLDCLLLGDVLLPTSRARLVGWLVGCRTGDQKIRAGLPSDWRCGDKTGGGGYGTNNDIAIVWPPGRKAILVASYLTESMAPLEDRNGALAAVGRAIVTAIT